MKPVKAYYKRVTFTFKFGAETSRGILYKKDSYFLVLKQNGITGIGECSPIQGLSIDDPVTYVIKLKNLCNSINIGETINTGTLGKYPSIKFAYEAALSDLRNGGKRVYFKNEFIDGKKFIPINGLIWMGKKEFMQEQILEKLKQGFKCIKIKVGAIDFTTELNILKWIRKDLKREDVEIRLDANGAFTSSDVFNKLKKLAQYNIHSIEQPVKAGLYNLMSDVIKKSPIPVALDEELIGIYGEEKKELIRILKPAYVILKPTLLGGISSCAEWIEIAEKSNIGWWVTSALESNIGLNVLAQWVGSFNKEIKQGLGTGNLYSNNIPSPLYIENAGLRYNPNVEWDVSDILR